MRIVVMSEPLTLASTQCAKRSRGAGGAVPPDEPALGETPGACIKATGDLLEAQDIGDEWPTLFEAFPQGIIAKPRPEFYSKINAYSTAFKSDKHAYRMHAYHTACTSKHTNQTFNVNI